MKQLMLMVCLLMLTSGCATIVKGSKQDIDVKTTPPGLTARINTQQCLTPCTLTNISRKSENIIIAKDGKEMVYALDKSFNLGWAVFGNIWNEVIYGLLVDWLSGAAYDIEPVNVTFELPKVPVAETKVN